MDTSASRPRSAAEQAILADLQKEPWMGCAPDSGSNRWFKLQLVDFRFGTSGDSDTVRAKFLSEPGEHTEWLAVDCKRVVPFTGGADEWTENPDKSWTRLPQPTSEPLHALLKEHYYGLEVTDTDPGGVVTLKWCFPPGNAKDASTWIGFYPLRDQQPDVPPSLNLRPNRAAFKYISKNTTSGEMRFNVASTLKSKSSRDDSYFFALHAHSIATMFATSQMLSVSAGAIQSFELGGAQVSPHDGVAMLKSGRRQLAHSSSKASPKQRAAPGCSMSNRVNRLRSSLGQAAALPQHSKLAEPIQPRREESKAGKKKAAGKQEVRASEKGEEPAELEEAVEVEAPIGGPTPSTEAPGEPLGDQSSGGGVDKLVVEPGPLEEEATDKLWYSVRIREGRGSALSLSWQFPPGNPSDSSSYISLYPLFDWESIPLPYSRPIPGGFGYKYITQNGVAGNLNFTVTPLTKAPAYNGAYVFALHSEDVVQALSQPVWLHNLKVTLIKHHSLMRRCEYQPLSRGRGRRADKPVERFQPPDKPETKKRKAPSALGDVAKKEEQRRVGGAGKEAGSKLVAAPGLQESKGAVVSGEGQLRVGAVMPFKKKHKAVNKVEASLGSSGARKKRARELPAVSASSSEEEEDEAGNWEFACLCGVEGTGFDDGRPMVQCDKCSQWQHVECIGVQPEQVEGRKYLCWRCEKSVPLKHRKGRFASLLPPEAGVAVKADPAGKHTDNDAAEQMLSLLRSDNTNPGQATEPAPKPSNVLELQAALQGCLQLSLDLGWASLIPVKVPRARRLDELYQLIQEHLCSINNRTTRVAQLRDASGMLVPRCTAEGGSIPMGYAFNEHDCVRVVCAGTNPSEPQSRQQLHHETMMRSFMTHDMHPFRLGLPVAATHMGVGPMMAHSMGMPPGLSSVYVHPQPLPPDARVSNVIQTCPLPMHPADPRW